MGLLKILVRYEELKANLLAIKSREIGLLKFVLI